MIAERFWGRARVKNNHGGDQGMSGRNETDVAVRHSSTMAWHCSVYSAYRITNVVSLCHSFMTTELVSL